MLAVDRDNADAEDLLTAPASGGEIRRFTLLVADLVDSTALSTRVEPETYRKLVGRYRDLVHSLAEVRGPCRVDEGWRSAGGVRSSQSPRGRSAPRGRHRVRLEITHAVSRLSEQAKRRFGVALTVRVGDSPDFRDR